MNETYKIIQGEPLKLSFDSHGDVQTLLSLLHDYYDLSWPRIGDLPAINPPGEEPIPFSTLSKIAKTGIVPAKWRRRFGVGAIDNRPRTSIHKEDMSSAHDTLYNLVTPERRAELIRLLAGDPDLPIVVTILEKETS